MNFLKSPMRSIAKYAIQSALGKFLKNELKLTNQDFSKKVLILSDLQFDCEVSPHVSFILLHPFVLSSIHRY